MTHSFLHLCLWATRCCPLVDMSSHRTYLAYDVFTDSTFWRTYWCAICCTVNNRETVFGSLFVFSTANPKKSKPLSRLCAWVSQCKPVTIFYIACIYAQSSYEACLHSMQPMLNFPLTSTMLNSPIAKCLQNQTTPAAYCLRTTNTPQQLKSPTTTNANP